MEHAGSLESTQEARVALGCRLGQLLRFSRAVQTSRVLHNSIVHAMLTVRRLLSVPTSRTSFFLKKKHFPIPALEDKP